MRSSLLTWFAVVGALLAGGATRAAAQSGDGPAPATPDPGTPPEPGAVAAKPPRAEVVVGVEVGVGGVLAGGSSSYAPGLGRGLLFGIRRGRFSLEWHLLGYYEATVDSDLVASSTENSVAMSSLGLRVEVAAAVSVYGGFATASVPVLTREPTTPLTIGGDSFEGLGPTAGIAYGWTRGDAWFGFELRLTALMLRDAAPLHVVATGPADAAGMIPIMEERADGLPVLFSLGFTVRGYVDD